jgi:hypothetical protein
MRRTLALVIVALALPGVALAAKPTTHTNHSKAAPKVMYILKGTLWSYTAASATAGGSVTIHVTHSNYHSRALIGQDLTFALSAKTKLAVSSHSKVKLAKSLGTVKDGTRGIVKFKGALKISNTTLLAALAPKAMTAFEVIAQRHA